VILSAAVALRRSLVGSSRLTMCSQPLPDNGGCFAKWRGVELFHAILDWRDIKSTRPISFKNDNLIKETLDDMDRWRRVWDPRAAQGSVSPPRFLLMS
jgi:hypothetical protein